MSDLSSHLTRTKRKLREASRNRHRFGAMVESLLQPFTVRRGGYPPVLCQLARGISEYLYDPSVIPALAASASDTRQKRTEGREAEVRVLLALTRRLDLTSLCAGLPGRGTFMHVSMGWIAEVAELPLHRVSRAMRQLKRCGLVEVSQHRKPCADGTWACAVSVKKVSRLLFDLLKLGELLDLARAHKRRRPTSKDPREETAWIAQQRTLLNVALSKSKKRPSAPRGPPPSHVDDATAEYKQLWSSLTVHDRQRVTRITLDLAHANPEWAKLDILKAAIRQLRF